MSAPSDKRPGIPMAWAVVQANGEPWTVYRTEMEAARTASTWNTNTNRREDYGPVRPCVVVPLYPHASIAAAPDLLAALKAMVEVAEGYEKSDAESAEESGEEPYVAPRIKVARAAIAKATGQATGTGSGA